MKEPLDKQPDAESFRVFLSREWADVHHSRIQEWSALGVVAGVHIGLIQLLAANPFSSCSSVKQRA